MAEYMQELIELAAKFLKEEDYTWNENIVENYSSNYKFFQVRSVRPEDIKDYIFQTLLKFPEQEIYFLSYMILDEAHINVVSDDNPYQGVFQGDYSSSFDIGFIKYCLKEISRDNFDEYFEKLMPALDKYIINFQSNLDEYEDEFDSNELYAINQHIRSLVVFKQSLVEKYITNENSDDKNDDEKEEK